MLALLLFAAPVLAQDRPAITDVRVGFAPTSEGLRVPTHKVGLFAPVLAKIASAQSVDGAFLVVETEDSEDSAVVSRFPVSIKSGDSLAFGYVKPGRTRCDVRVSLELPGGERIAGPTVDPVTSEIGDYLYLSLGAKLDELAAGLVLKEKKAAEEGKAAGRINRFALHATDASRLPDQWLGYDGIDLVVLDLSDAAFIDAARPRFKSLLDWVGRGGRLVVAVPGDRVESIGSLLGETIDAVPPFDAKSLVVVETWAGLQNKPLPPRGQGPMPLARLNLAKLGQGPWETIAQLDLPNERPHPLIARTPYGFGSITYLAFPVSSGSFARWSGQAEFFRALADQIGPRYVVAERTKESAWGESAGVSDWGAQLNRELDVFDVPTPSFGMVAFLMLAALLAVSALDYFLLRRLVGRLEATWVTLPLLVLGISAAAYWWAQSPEQEGLRLNQFDLIDVAILDPAATPSSARVGWHGSAFFTVRGDAIRSLTVKSQPSRELPGPASELTTWFGRPDDGPAGMGRAGGQTLSQKAYDMSIRDGEIARLPLPFRATKSFLGGLDRPASQARVAPPPPFRANLVFHPRTHHVKISGEIENRLGVDLDDACLFVFDRVYRLPGPLKPNVPVPIEIKEIDNGLLLGEWRDKTDTDRPMTRWGRYDPGKPLRNIMFRERLDPGLKVGDHLFRRLDWSWRLRDDPRVVNIPLSAIGPRDAILIARARLGANDGPAAHVALSDAAGAPLVPADDRVRREAYIRAILPMQPQP